MLWVGKPTPCPSGESRRPQAECRLGTRPVEEGSLGPLRSTPRGRCAERLIVKRQSVHGREPFVDGIEWIAREP